jgi:hypothetical protein
MGCARAFQMVEEDEEERKKNNNNNNNLRSYRTFDHSYTA